MEIKPFHHMTLPCRFFSWFHRDFLAGKYCYTFQNEEVFKVVGVPQMIDSKLLQVHEIEHFFVNFPLENFEMVSHCSFYQEVGNHYYDFTEKGCWTPINGLINAEFEETATKLCPGYRSSSLCHQRLSDP